MPQITKNNKKDEGKLKKEFEKEEAVSFFKSSGKFIVEVLKIVIISLAVIIPIRVFLIQPFYVKGASMEPNFHDNQYLIIDEITYRFQQPARGDVVVIKNPANTSTFFIKRLIGLPNEKIEMKDGHVYIYNSQYPDGLKLNEDYLDPENVNNYGSNNSIALKENEYFVIGDNRKSSLDSRSFGPIQKKYIVGRTWLRIWPFDKFKQYNALQYNTN